MRASRTAFLHGSEREMAEQGKKKKKVKMEEIFEDDNLFDAFYSYSQRNLMSETIDLWKAVESLDNQPTPEERGRRFKEIAAEYFLRGCRSPVNLNHDLIDRLRHTHLDLQYGSIVAPPSDLITDLRKEIWLLMASSCLPAFLDSDVFDSFQNGVLFSSKEEFSRYKAEQFFGSSITGPLQRSEIIEVFQHGMYHRRRQVFGRILNRRRREGGPSSSKSHLSSSHPPPSTSVLSPSKPSATSPSPPKRRAAPTTDFSFLTDFSEETPTDRSDQVGGRGDREEASGFLEYM